MSLDVQTKIIDSSAANSQQNGVERKTLNDNVSSFAACFTSQIFEWQSHVYDLTKSVVDPKCYLLLTIIIAAIINEMIKFVSSYNWYTLSFIGLYYLSWIRFHAETHR